MNFTPPSMPGAGLSGAVSGAVGNAVSGAASSASGAVNSAINNAVNSAKNGLMGGLGNMNNALGNMLSNAQGGLFSRLQPLFELGQGKRLLQLETALPSQTLIIERADWQEGLNGWAERQGEADQRDPRQSESAQSAFAQSGAPRLNPIIATIDCLSANTHLELKALIGEQMSLRVMLADGRYRVWHGYVTRAAQLGSDGTLSRYRLQLGAFTHFLSLRTDARVFLGQRADDVINAVLRSYPQANYRLELSPQALQAAPLRDVITQYNETDEAFVARLLREEGWNWRLEHADTAAGAATNTPTSAPTNTPTSAATNAAQAKHTLVIFDSEAPRPQLGPVRFGKTGARQLSPRGGQAEDTITAIALRRQVQANAVTHAAWDPRQLAGVSAQAQSPQTPDNLPSLEIYEGRNERHYAQHDPVQGEDAPQQSVAQARAQLTLARHQLHSKTLFGQSAVRRLAPGAEFALTEHSLYSGQGLLLGERSDNRYTLLSVHHSAANNLGSEAAQLLQANDLEGGSYRNRFTAAPAAARLVPAASRKPAPPGIQTALVVGHPGQPLTTERDARVRIQYPWQRGQAPLAGGLDGPLAPGQAPGQAPTGHAPGQANASPWVRVAQASAGANWGAVFIPRIGTEVLIDYINGDIDRPIITGQLHNGQDSQPWPAGVDSGANHPGTLSGWHSQTLDGQGHNHWVLDDATNQLRMRLASQSQGSPWSELTLGHLISQAATSSQRGAWLGSGFYGHTEGWASLRAGQGLLISTTARAGSYASAQSTQMDTQEAVAQLKGAQQLGQNLSQAAQAQGAKTLSSHQADKQQALQSLIQATDPGQEGLHPHHKKARGRDEAEPVEQFAQAHIVLDASSTQAWASPASVASFAGQDTSLTAQGDIHHAAAHTAAWASGQTTSLYTHQGELQTIAANGNLTVRAHTDRLEILADKDITVISVNNEITITASQRIEMVGGDSKVVLEGGNIDFVTPGSFTVKAASHEWAGGGSGSAALAALPDSRAKLFTEQFLARNQISGKPVPDMPYRIELVDGSVITGRTDAAGKTQSVMTADPQSVKLYWVSESQDEPLEDDDMTEEC